MTADDENIKFTLQELNGYTVDTLTLYSSCTGDPVSSLYYDYDSLIILEAYNVDTSHEYFLKVTGTKTEDPAYTDICTKFFHTEGTPDPCNLVVNPSFEDGPVANTLGLLENADYWYDGCPQGTCNGYTCAPFGAPGNTPDIMDVNSSSNANNGANTGYGPQLPYDGDRYASIGSIESFF